ncbi:hypothetical protein ACFE04_021078 [Oxalis oulophora]
MLRGLLAYETGFGVAMMANKFPGVFAATCLNVAKAHDLSGMSMSAEDVIEILDAWLITPFKGPFPASVMVKDEIILLRDLAKVKKLYSLDAGSIIHSLCFCPNRYWFCAIRFVENLKVDLKTEKIIYWWRYCFLEKDYLLY